MNIKDVNVIKNDLINTINNEKYYEEKYFFQTFFNDQLKHLDKINGLKDQLIKIALLNTSLQMIPTYVEEIMKGFQQPQQVINNGQSHIE